MKTHITWNIETKPGKCPDCETETLLALPSRDWRIDDPPEDEESDITVDEEVSGHFCPKCRRLTSLSLNTKELF